MSVLMSNCGVPPLVLPIVNVTFPDVIAVNRGVKLLLGGQTEGLRMTFTLNNTRVRSSADCGSLSTPSFSACIGSSGGIYDSSKSKTFRQETDLEKWDVQQTDYRPKNANVVQGYEVATFPDTDPDMSISDYPFEIWADESATNKSALALGTSSSLIQRLIKNVSAPSASLGLFYGSRSQDFGQDGELVIGGVNLARLNKNGSFYNNTMWSAGLNIPCPLQAYVTSMVLINDDGSFPLVDDPAAKVAFCIDPLQAAFSFSERMWTRWANFTQRPLNPPADGSANYTNQTYPADRERLIGSLKITLDGGYETIIPHYELVSLERGNNTQGKYDVINSSRIMAAVVSGRTDYGQDVPILGGVFLSQNYLIVDYTNNKFSITPAKTGKTNSSPTIETLCRDRPGPSNRGVIIGVPIGAALLCLVTIGMIFLWKKGYRLRLVRKQTTSLPQIVSTTELSNVVTGKELDVNIVPAPTETNAAGTHISGTPTHPLPQGHRPSEAPTVVSTVSQGSAPVEMGLRDVVQIDTSRERPVEVDSTQVPVQLPDGPDNQIHETQGSTSGNI